MKRYSAVMAIALVLILSSASLAGIFGSSGNVATLLTGLWNYALTVSDIAAGGVITRRVTSAGIADPVPTTLNEVQNAFHFTGSACTPATYENQVYGIGHNLSNNFTRLNTGYATTFFGMESNYCGNLNEPQVEFYWRAHDTGGTLHSLIEASMHHDGGYSDILLGGDVVNFVNHSAVQVWKLDTTVIPWQSYWYGRTLSEPHTINSTANGCPWIQQRNSGNTAYLAYPCFRDANGGTAGGEELYYGPTGSLPWYVLVNPQTGTTFPNSGATFQTTSIASSQNILQLQGPSSAVDYNGLLIVGGGASNEIGSMIENSAGGDAIFKLQVDSASGRDPYTRLYNLSTFWAYGLDNSDSDAFVISQNASLGTNNRIRIDTGGAVTQAGIALASVATTTAGTHFYCNNCNVATPCTSGGAGAWAFRTSGGTWACPF